MHHKGAASLLAVQAGDLKGPDMGWRIWVAGDAPCMVSCDIHNGPFASKAPTCAQAVALADGCAATCTDIQKDDLLVMAKNQPCHRGIPLPPPAASVNTKIGEGDEPNLPKGVDAVGPCTPSIQSGKVMGLPQPHLGAAGDPCGTAMCGPNKDEMCPDCGDVSSDKGMPKDPTGVDTPNDGLPPLDTKPMHHKGAASLLAVRAGDLKGPDMGWRIWVAGDAPCMVSCDIHNGPFASKAPTCAQAVALADGCAATCTDIQKDDLLVMAKNQPCHRGIPLPPPAASVNTKIGEGDEPNLPKGVDAVDPYKPSIQSGKVMGLPQPHLGAAGDPCGTAMCGPNKDEMCPDCGDVSSD